jgi:hypothetical protein
MELGRLSWRGIVDVEADRVALRDETGAPTDIRDLFVGVDDIGVVREVVTAIGGGATHTSLTWDNDDPPTDSKVPGLASLLRYLDEERPTTKNIYVNRFLTYRPHIDEHHEHLHKRIVQTVHPRLYVCVEGHTHTFSRERIVRLPSTPRSLPIRLLTRPPPGADAALPGAMEREAAPSQSPKSLSRGPARFKTSHTRLSSSI